MFNRRLSAATSGQTATGGLICSAAVLFLIFAGRAVYAWNGGTATNLIFVIILCAEFLSIAGFVLSLVALLKTAGKTGVRGSKTLAAAGLLVNGFFTLLTVNSWIINTVTILKTFLRKYR